MKYSLIAAAIVTSTLAAAEAAPRYVDKDARATVRQMVKAHGGYETWSEAPSVHLELAMYLAILPPAEGRTPKDNWRYYEVTVEPISSKTLVEVPWENTDGYEAGLTRESYWIRPLTFDPTFQEPTAMLAWYHYGMINLPFLTQSDTSVLETTAGIENPLTGKALKGVRMTFEPGEGRKHEGVIDLYIDPDTNLLAAWRLSTMYAALPGDVLPDEVPVPPGAPLRIVENYQTYDGVVLPQAYASLTPDGKAAGTHVILSASFTQPFPHDALTPPDDARIVFSRDE